VRRIPRAHTDLIIMSEKRAYLDHAAGTPLDPRVKAAMEPYMSEEFGNAGGLYREGRRAKDALDDETAADPRTHRHALMPTGARLGGVQLELRRSADIPRKCFPLGRFRTGPGQAGGAPRRAESLSLSVRMAPIAVAGATRRQTRRHDNAGGRPAVGEPNVEPAHAAKLFFTIPVVS